MKRVVSEYSLFWNSHTQPGRLPLVLLWGNGAILVRRVPATGRVQCGEAWIDHHTVQKLAQITQEASGKGLQVEGVPLKAQALCDRLQ